MINVRVFLLVVSAGLSGCSSLSVKTNQNTRNVLPLPEAEKESRLLSQYAQVIQSAVTNQWLRPEGTDAGLKCLINVQQLPGGHVIDITTNSPCNANTEEKDSLINAVRKADPLPYAGYESVFTRRLNFTFQYQGD